MTNQKVTMVIFTKEPIPENTILGAREGNIPQFALKKTNVNMVLQQLKNIPNTNKGYSIWVKKLQTKIGQSLGLRKEWIQKRPYMAVFTVNKEKIYRPLRHKYTGVIRGHQNGTNRTVIIERNLNWPFIGNGKTLPLGNLKNTGLPHNGFNEYIILPGTRYNSAAKSINLGPYIKQLHNWKPRNTPPRPKTAPPKTQRPKTQRPQTARPKTQRPQTARGNVTIRLKSARRQRQS